MSPPASFPIEPTGKASAKDLRDFVCAEHAGLEAQLLREGRLLFRGWDVANTEALLRVVEAFSRGAPLFNYAGGASPRKELGGGSYSSTEYPPQLKLALHNELSYAGIYPSRLYFLCLVAPEFGGETTLGDSRQILADIDPSVREKFRSRGVRYVRNLDSQKGSGYAWQDAFGTDDPAEIDKWSRDNGGQVEWLEDLVRISQTCPATVLHPTTHAEVWFNQADGFHPSALDPVSYAEMIALRGTEDRFRLNSAYGDGEPFDHETLAHIRAAIDAQTEKHRWQRGDILVVDNLLTAHGRMPFIGPRKIALAMT